MTEQDKINENIQRQIDAQNARIDNVLTKVEMMVLEAQQQREDIRRLHERQDAMQERHDNDMREIRNEIRDALKNLQGLTIAAMVGIAAISVGVLGILRTTAQNINYQQNSPPQAAQYQIPEPAAKPNP